MVGASRRFSADEVLGQPDAAVAVADDAQADLKDRLSRR
jgi:hypothetical protein